MRLEAIWRYPVKSMAGERLDVGALGPLGVPGDRAAYVVDGRGETSRRARGRELLGLRGGTAPTARRPSTATPGSAPAADAFAPRRAGARLVRAGELERFDILPLLVATDGAVGEAGLDVRRLRPNLVIGGVEGLAERAWEGRFLRIGDAVIGLATCAGAAS